MVRSPREWAQALDREGPLRVAMVGGGLRSAIGRTHVMSMQLDHRFRLTSGCFSRDAQVNRASAEAYGLQGEDAFGDLTSLLTDGPTVDVVVVATPIDQHERQLHTILDAGLIAVTDKPLAVDASAARRLVRRVESDPTRLFTIYNYTGYPAVRDLRERIVAGALGDLHHVALEMPQDTYQRLVNEGQGHRVQPWRLIDRESATVSLDLFVHLHSLAAFLTGRGLRRVTARSRAVTGIRPGLIDSVDALLDFDNDMTGTATYGKAHLGAPNGLHVRIYGTLGSAEWRHTEPEWLRLADAHGRISMQNHATVGSSVAGLQRYERFKAGHPTGFVEAFANYYSDIADAIEEGVPSDFTLPHTVSVEGLLACEAMARSSHDAAPVELPTSWHEDDTPIW